MKEKNLEAYLMQASEFFGANPGFRLSAATTFSPGAIIIDWFDPQIFDDVYRKFILFDRIDKRRAPGETTGGFDQTALGDARVAPVRNLGFSATNPTRAERTRRTLKAIVKDISFGVFDMSVGPQQGTPWGDLQAKDVADQKNAALRKWSSLAYAGDIDNDANEFDGLYELIGTATGVASNASIVDGINTAVATMINSSDQMVMPTAIYCNALVQFMIGQELLTIGEKQTSQVQIYVGGRPMTCQALATPGGLLPLIVDPFVKAAPGTPTTYPTYIVSEDKLSWQYAEVLGQPGGDPKTFEIVLTNALDRQYKTVMFGALELLGGTAHHKILNVASRTTVIKPAATA